MPMSKSPEFKIVLAPTYKVGLHKICQQNVSKYSIVQLYYAEWSPLECCIYLLLEVAIHQVNRASCAKEHQWLLLQVASHHDLVIMRFPVSVTSTQHAEALNAPPHIVVS